MALPMSRVMEINQRAIELLNEYREELPKALIKGDLLRVGEIKASADWINKIVLMANKPYIDKLNLPDDVLRAIGFLDDDKNSKTPPNSGRYPWGDVSLDDILRGLGISDDEDP